MRTCNWCGQRYEFGTGGYCSPKCSKESREKRLSLVFLHLFGLAPAATPRHRA
jgi:hypothetical protein